MGMRTYSSNVWVGLASVHTSTVYHVHDSSHPGPTTAAAVAIGN